MGERVTHLDPQVDIRVGKTGVLMETTETTIRHEAFLDPLHARDATKNRSLNAILKVFGAYVLALSAGAFALNGVAQLANGDLGSNDTTKQQQDVEEVLLGAGVVYETFRYSKRKAVERNIGEKQRNKAKYLSDSEE